MYSMPVRAQVPVEAEPERMAQIELEIRNALKTFGFTRLTETGQERSLTLCNYISYVRNLETGEVCQKEVQARSNKVPSDTFFLFSQDYIASVLSQAVHKVADIYQQEMFSWQHRKLVGKIINTNFGGYSKRQAAKLAAGIVWKQILDPDIARFTIRVMGKRADSYHYNLLVRRLAEAQEMAEKRPGLLPLWLMFNEVDHFEAKSSARCLGYYFSMNSLTIQAFANCETIEEELAIRFSRLGISKRYLDVVAQMSMQQSRELLGRWIILRNMENFKFDLPLMSNALKTNLTIARTLLRHEFFHSEIQTNRPFVEAIFAWRPKKVRLAAQELQLNLDRMTWIRTGIVVTDTEDRDLSSHECMELLIKVEEWLQTFVPPNQVAKIVNQIG